MPPNLTWRAGFPGVGRLPLVARPAGGDLADEAEVGGAPHAVGAAVLHLGVKGHL